MNVSGETEAFRPADVESSQMGVQFRARVRAVGHAVHGVLLLFHESASGSFNAFGAHGHSPVRGSHPRPWSHASATARAATETWVKLLLSGQELETRLS